MSTGDILKGQFQWIHNTMDGTIGDCAPESLSRTLPNSTIGAISGIYAHVIFAEDRQVNAQIQGKPMIFAQDGWADKLGIRPPEGRMDLEWRSSQTMDLPSFMAYAAAVYANTNDYLSTISDQELEREMEAFGRKTTVGAFLASTIATHLALHLGEIAALKGVQGLKGLPM